MTFNSLEYFVLLFSTIIVFFAVPALARLWVLIAASLVFYAAWSVPFTGLILLSAVVDYGAGLLMRRHDAEPRTRALVLTLALAANLALLGYFKYSNFFLEQITALLGAEHYHYLSVVLPPGISFYTFQTMSYSIDVYRREIEPTRSFPKFLLFVSFFPQLVAGPIERAGHLMSQFDHVIYRRFAPENLLHGARLICWGLFKKVMIADYCGLMVDRYYGAPGLYDGTAGLLATYLFGIQIYCDFSAYSDIARGSARCFGVDLMQNFDQPLLSPSMAAFWRRWHISLGNWIRDYLYRPLGGNRAGGLRALFNVFVVAALSGLWHGAAWHFVAWGVYHGLLMVVIVLIQRTRIWRWLSGELGAMRGFAGWFLQFHLSNIGFVMFRAGSFSEIVLILREIAVALRAGLPLSPGHELAQSLGFGFVFAFLGLSVLERRFRIIRRIDASAALATCFYGGLVALMLLFGNAAETPFIYFQF